MVPKTISIHKAAQRLTEEVSLLEVPKLANISGLEESGFDADDDRYFHQTMAHRNGIVDAIKSGTIRALGEFSMMPVSWHKDMPGTQPIRMDDFIAFANSHGFSITDDSLLAGATKPIPRQRAQEIEIMSIIDSLKYTAKSLPKRQPGKAGVKSEVWKCASEKSQLFNTRGIFDKAWQRLLHDNGIKEG